DHGWMLDEQQHVVRDAPFDPGLRQAALPLESLGVGDEARLHDLQHPVGHTRLPLIAHWLPTIPSARLAAPHTTRPMTPPNPCAKAARNPTKRAPMAANTAITPRCQRLSIARLRTQPKNAPSARPAPT